MFLATINQPKQLLYVSLIEHVRTEELIQSREELIRLLAELAPGFRLLTDLGRLEFMSVDCGTEFGRLMELFDQSRVELVVRVIPDQKKDIGLGILSLFHYPRRPRTITCESMVEAARLLSL